MKKKKIIYFTDELNDEFFKANIKPKVIDEKYKYISHNIFYKTIEFIYYNIILLPVAFIHCFIVSKIKYENTKVLKTIGKKGYYVYANHTNNISDAFSPSMICRPKKPYIIVNAQNMNIPILKGSTKMLGALPLPASICATKNFFSAQKNILEKGHGIIVYPEAHIWPYYTHIRPFKSTSFKYPIKYNVPSFCFTTTYQKARNPKKVKTTIYVDGPFYADNDLPLKQQTENLRNKIYETMNKRSKNNSYEKIIYIRKEHKND